MKSARLLVVVLLFLACGCSRKERSQASSQADDNSPQTTNPEAPPIKAATPEDPGPTATVIVPGKVLKGQRKPSQTEPETESGEQPPSIDHPVHLEAKEPQNFLHKVFQVSNHAQFTFLVPPRQGNARLRGTFRSFTKRNDPDSSNRTAGVDLLLLNEQEFSDFLHGRSQSVTYELDSANNQTVDWRVPTTYGESQTYYLVFSNPAAKAKIKFVEADFTVSFE